MCTVFTVKMAPHAVHVECPYGFCTISGSERKRSISGLDEEANWAGIAVTVGSSPPHMICPN